MEFLYSARIHAFLIHIRVRNVEKCIEKEKNVKNFTCTRVDYEYSRIIFYAEYISRNYIGALS